MENILAVVIPILSASIMKKDCEVPWYLRILRWGAVIFVLTYGALLVAEKAKEVL